jgi:hypothetical protein
MTRAMFLSDGFPDAARRGGLAKRVGHLHPTVKEPRE